MKISATALWTFLAVFLMDAGLAHALDVTVRPSVITLARGQSYTKILKYTLRASAPYNGTVASDHGNLFEKDMTYIKSIPTRLSASMVNGRAQITETLQVPADLVEMAIARKSNPLIYQRGFYAGVEEKAVYVTIRIASEAAADFSIRRLELYFPNRRGQTTVQQNTEDIKAYAEVRFTGTGILEGRWEVDGRVIQIFNKYLTFGDVAILESPKAPVLPTFQTGTHVVRLIIEKPAVSFNLPAIVYFVTPREHPEQRHLELAKPAPDALLDFSDFELSWQRADQATLYLLEFTEEKRVIFSAMTEKTAYTVTQALMQHYFLPGRSYQWRVKGFDNDGQKIMESEERTFRFAEIPYMEKVTPSGAATHSGIKTGSKLLKPGEAQGINPQPEPPGKDSRTSTQRKLPSREKNSSVNP